MWSLKSKILLFTFPWNNLQPRNGVEYIYSNTCGSNGHYDFYGNLLLPLLDRIDSDVVLLCQQDIMFTRKIHDLVQLCHDHNSIILGKTNPEYFAIFDQYGNISYPRLWEGAILYPTNFLREASKKGISMSHAMNQVIDQDREMVDQYRLYDCFFKNTTTHKLVKLEDWLRKAPDGLPRSEKLVELTIYSRSTNQPYRIVDDYTAHFQGPEKTHRNIPNIYENLNQLMTNQLVARRSINNCAFMFYLAEAVDESPDLVTALLANEDKFALRNFVARVTAMSVHAQEWMTEEQWRRFQWAYGKIMKCWKSKTMI
jgi:hypothetical protein